MKWSFFHSFGGNEAWVEEWNWSGTCLIKGEGGAGVEQCRDFMTWHYREKNCKIRFRNSFGDKKWG